MRRTRRSAPRGARYASATAGVALVTALAAVAGQAGDTGSRPRTLAPATADGASATILEFERHYTLSVGDKGEDLFELPAQLPSCTGPGFAFESAEIVYLSRRFGEAQIVATPERGCVRCGPIVVRRYHEPTGELRYRLRVHRRAVPAACDGGER